MVLEANVGKDARNVWLPPGSYFVRKRGRDRLYEGAVSVIARRKRRLDTSQLQAVKYAKLVRKGGGPKHVLSTTVGGFVSSAPISDYSTQLGAGISTILALRPLSLDLVLWLSQSSLETDILSSTLTEVGGAVGVSKVFDLGRFSLSGGVGAGLAYLRQSYTSDRITPTRARITPLVDTLLRSEVPFFGSFFVVAEGRLRVRFLSLQDTDGDEPGTKSRVGAIGYLGIGKFW